MRLRTRLLLFNAALVPIVVVAVWAGGAYRLRRELEANLDQSLTTARSVLELVIEDRVKSMSLMSEPLGQDPRVRGGLASRSGQGEGGPPRAVDTYFLSFMDEFSATRQDLMMLFGADGTVAYGEVGATSAPSLSSAVSESRQLRALLGGLGDRKSATMLWGGARARSETPVFGRLGAPVYLVHAERLEFNRTGLGSNELEGIAVLGQATGDLGSAALQATRAGILLVDGQTPLVDSFGAHAPGAFAETSKAAAEWVAAQPAHLGVGQSRAWHVVVRQGHTLWCTLLDLPGLVPGPVRVAVVFSGEVAAERAGWVFAVSTLGALVLFLGVILLGLWHSASISRPVLALAAAARRVGGGELDVRVEDARKDELGELARQFNQMVEGLKERERARTALGQYLSPEMAKVLIEQKDRLQLGGARRELSLLFGDIAGFTTLSEERAPEEVVGFLNQHLDRLIPLLSERGAYIDKFEGDAIMAFWNAPLPMPDHAERACAAALALDAEVSRQAAGWAQKGFPRVTMRWGINTGEAVVGNLGSSHKANYTAIGDCVNLASRLEGANKLYGTNILVGEGTYALASGRFEFRELDRLRVKGRHGGVRVFELLCERGALTPERRTVISRFQEGYEAFQAQRFAEARAAFQAALDASSGTDSPSRVLLDRAAHYANVPPPPGWDGVFTAASKDPEVA